MQLRKGSPFLSDFFSQTARTQLTSNHLINMQMSSPEEQNNSRPEDVTVSHGVLKRFRRGGRAKMASESQHGGVKNPAWCRTHRESEAMHRNLRLMLIQRKYCYFLLTCDFLQYRHHLFE